MQRRDFLTSAGAVLGAATLAGNRSVLADANDRVRVGVIGTGIRGQLLIDFINDLPGIEVAACCDVLPFRLAEGVAHAAGNPAAYDNHLALLEDKDIDAVIVATPFYHHDVAALDALSAGKHVYCEKTMVKGAEQTRRVVRAFRDSNLVFQTGFQWRSSPLYETAVEMIQGGAIGEIAAVNCQWNRNADWRRELPDPSLERQINWRMYRQYSSGLAAELCAHQMDFCNRILPSGVESISGFGGVDFWKDGRETYDNIQLACRYREGVTANFQSLTTNSAGGYGISVLGKKGSIALSFSEGWFIPEGAGDDLPDGVDLVSGASAAGTQGASRRTDAQNSYKIDAPTDDPTAHALAVFAESVRNGRQPPSNVESGAVVSMMVQMGIDAMDSKSTVRWSDGYELPAG